MIVFSVETIPAAAAGFPVGDPQFWLVTAAAGVAAWAVWRLARGKKIVPGRRRARPKGASLTIEGRPAPASNRRKTR